MRHETLADVYLVTERRDGKTFHTKYVTSVWVLGGLPFESEEANSIARKNGGDMLVTPQQNRPYHELYRTVADW